MTTPSLRAANHAAPAVIEWAAPAVSVGLGLLLVVSTWVGDVEGAALGTAAAVLAAQALVVHGWHDALAVTAARSGAALGWVLAVAAVVVAILSSETPSLGPLAVLLGVSYVAVIAQQLMRRDDREGLTASMAATVSLAATVVLGAAWVVLAATPSGREATVVTACALMAAGAARVMPVTRGAVLVALLLGVLVGAVAGWADASVGIGGGVTLGLTAGAVVAAVEVLVRQVPRLRAAWGVSGALPVLAVAPLAYAVTRLVLS